MTATIAVFASGGGSNLQALLNHFMRPAAAKAGRIVLVVSDNASAGALERAQQSGISHVTLSDYRDGRAMVEMLQAHHISLIALAGYLKKVPAEVTQRYRGRMVNVHPALLPAFGGPGMYGSRVHRAVLSSGVRVSGVTVHFVDDVYDHGAVIAQNPVPVFPSDDITTLAARVLRTEHGLFPLALEAVASGRVSLTDDGKVRGTV